MSRSRNEDINDVDYNDDNYVAQLLAKDARDCSRRYSALGIYGPSKRSINGAPKPNTRFLKHILRETDSHNENLKRKEEEEARQRMRTLLDGRGKPSRSSRSDGRDDRVHKRRRVESPERQDQNGVRPHHRDRHGKSRIQKGEKEYRYSGGDGDTISRARKRHHLEDRPDKGDTARESGQSGHDRKGERDHHRRHQRAQELSKYEHGHPAKDQRENSGPRRSRSDRRAHDRHGRSRSRSKSPTRTHRQRRRSRNREEKIEKHMHMEDKSGDLRADTHTSVDKKPPPLPPQTCAEDARSRHMSPNDRSSTSDDSDPLSDLIGPAPPTAFADNSQPIQSRGRGVYRTTNSSNIDAHFSSKYDPALDIHLEDDNAAKNDHPGHIRPVPGLFNPKEADKHANDDWDMALEALRDREIWKRKGAERLREAGFDDRVVEKWEANKSFAGLGSNDHKEIESVRWAKKGEGREWDRGKFVDENGHISVKAPW
ncbi:TPA_exp: Uncharacterized protein A8136_7104 [Trichophyton benhamiae CBS 112371]|uniref:Pre-mRNA-splicing factor 38B n=1 Tax=Arthroderma benhamiae (strain ATCC MYA-4681 / CBS 112371) TaxID=663331 RepID=D4ASY1_ARTBC|nr:uncharacterized protein ARB_07345 [Trichophyton benhamiae CBS 112371]EFE33881.1 conserved hypothetical protein [Trichophyton benhamiae CBS 112371]DAA76875.1 TPA_exp: Uncharacterized protein A8136_7104 [Trichophyton benhamiae CBS 112371]